MGMGKKNVLKSSFFVSIATFLSRILGLVRVRLEALVLGGGEVASAWQLAILISNIFRRILGEGALGSAMIPLISQIEHDKGTERVRKDVAVILVALSVVLGAIVIIIGGVSILLSNLASSSSFLNTERMRLMFKILPILAPYAFFICMVGAINSVLNCAKVFFLPALGAVLLNIFMISGLWLCYKQNLFTHDVDRLSFLSYMVVSAGALQMMLSLLLMKIKGWFPIFKLSSFQDCSALKRLWELALPGMIGASALQISVGVDKGIATWIGAQAVPAIAYVERIIDVPIGIIAVSICSVLTTELSKQVAEKNWKEFESSISFWMRQVFFITVPMAAWIVLFRMPILRLLCMGEGGRFSADDLAATNMVAIFYGIGVPAFCSLKVITSAFTSMKKVKTAMLVSICAIVLNLCLNLILMRPLKQGGIALATTISSVVNNVILLNILKKYNLNCNLSDIIKSLLRTIVITGISVMVLWPAYYYCSPMIHLGWWIRLFMFSGLGLVYVAVYIVVAKLCRCNEFTEFVEIFRRKVKSKKGNV